MKSGWVHFNLRFREYEKIKRQLYRGAKPQVRPTGAYKQLIRYLKKIVQVSGVLIDRYFYLFEPDPHLFLALEVKDLSKIRVLKKKIGRVRRPGFIDSAQIQLSTRDETNGERTLDFFQTATRYAFFRVDKEYKPGYNNNDETKLIHCLSNQLFYNRENEIDFYLRCLKYRGVTLRGPRN